MWNVWPALIRQIMQICGMIVFVACINNLGDGVSCGLAIGIVKTTVESNELEEYD